MDKIDILDNPEKIAEIDKGGMLETAAGMPEMLVEAGALAASVAVRQPKKIGQIVIAGMGGSAISGNIVADLLRDQSAPPVFVNRDYTVPAFVGRETLFFALSYSGNTEETLAAVKEAAKRGALIVCVTSGGKLKEIASANKGGLYLVPAGYQPRAALPFLLVALLKGLEDAGVHTGLQPALAESIALLRQLRSEYGPEKPLRGNEVKQLAKKLLGKIPIVIGSSGTTAAAALRLKCQFNENSKVTALFNLFPELNHNEIVSLAALSREDHKFALVFLRDQRDAERVKKRMAITKSLIGRQLGGVSEVWSQGKGVLASILSLIYFGDLLSVYLAVLSRVDPTPVVVIARLKKELSR
ncbi:bifunctional phosphoglucose/phosphomannose isomerase [Candidatus Margulisiibacteriota bacterium]